MSIIDCASYLRDIFNNTLPAFETDPDAIKYFISLLKEYKAIMQAVDEMKQVLVCRLNAAEHEQKVLEAELTQIDPSYRESISPKAFQATQLLSVISSKIAASASSNSLSPNRPYGSEIIGQLAVMELELFSLEAQLAEIDEKQGQMQDVLSNLQQQRRRLDEFNDGKYLETTLLHEQKQVALLTEIEQIAASLEHSIAIIKNDLQCMGADMGDSNIDSLAKGVLEVAAVQQRITDVLETPEYRIVGRIPPMSPREIDIETDRIRAELTEIIEQLEDV